MSGAETTGSNERAHERDRQRRRRVETAGAWGLSLLLHAAIIAVLASIVLVVANDAEIDTTLTLRPDPPDAGARDSESGDGQASGGAPSLDRMSETTQADATSAPLPSLPMPAAVGAPAASPTALTSMDPALTDPAFAVMAELAQTPSAQQPVGRGANPLLAGTSPGFQELVGGIGGRGLDVVIVLDATESMGPYITEAKQRIRDVIGVITGILTVNEQPPENVRFGIVAYKDYGDDFGVGAVRGLPLTSEFDAVRQFIDEIFVSGGGDEPEPIHEALDAATDRRMGWNKRKMNVVVLVGDAPVHSSGRRDAIAAARKFQRALDGTVNAIDVGRDRQNVLADFGNIASAGGGSAFRLGDEDAFWQHLIVSVFGERFERDVEHIVERYTQNRGGP